MESLIYAGIAIGILISIVWLVFPFVVLDRLKSIDTSLKHLAGRSDKQAAREEQADYS